jgi:DNA repair exonuclease SbcCD ATPase subunit
LETVKKKREAAQNESTEVRTRLKIHGEEGLHEKLQSARSRLAHLRRENEAMIRRAQAARLLFVTMKGERDKARRAYVAPLKEKIERLGRLVFNNSFAVEVTEELSVAGRTMDGSTVPFESLSGGTKEQISLISRLACAMTVSKDGGAALILDDALGYTDPERLKLMGAVLAKAGQECQIIILTCVPDRYSNIGEATVVRLG